jgi:hypothetical protein
MDSFKPFNNQYLVSFRKRKEKTGTNVRDRVDPDLTTMALDNFLANG